MTPARFKISLPSRRRANAGRRIRRPERLPGRPDVAPMQEVILNEVRDRILKHLAATDVETLMRVWLHDRGADASGAAGQAS